MAWTARRSGSLSRSGAAAATVVGGVSAAAGWGWAALLITWFAASSLLSRVGGSVKAERTRATLPPGGARNALQVWANGGVYAAAALLATRTDSPTLAAAALGALAAAAADTWATEIGVLIGGRPRSIITWHEVEPGLSGGVTLAGSLGGVLGALAVAVAARGLIAEAALWPLMPLALAGVLGGLGDSLLGATVQARRHCARCARWTERATHDCGTATEHGRGWRWMTNDTVNLLATFIGAGASALLLSPYHSAVP